MEKFIKDLKKSGGRVLDIIAIYPDKKMIYYLEYGTDPIADVKIKVFTV